jgi:hypothetical protein
MIYYIREYLQTRITDNNKIFKIVIYLNKKVHCMI